MGGIKCGEVESSVVNVVKSGGEGVCNIRE